MVAAAGSGTADTEDATGAGADRVVGGGVKGWAIMPMRAVKKAGRRLLQAVAAPIYLAGIALYLLWVAADTAFDDALTKLTIWQLRRQRRFLDRHLQHRRLTKVEKGLLTHLHKRLMQEERGAQDWKRKREEKRAQARREYQRRRGR